ncbi:short-subunit dehydrogenase [Okibacterium sp. HSC-33S16]|uniref:SDR family NAD(P)-dependent oxidoreductase n=1 Tax=Okibacterium sp. HSC-33S16 TaxID=2910965 RepID=UPI00209D30CA|nr:SDR family NAD(P)-dependent oxidoreductase [Okibacterium sp. HSC-33S16]MCP2030276.1 short-subunit dehydrogenase [Okibacterium sp. HSC-33S16]
MAFTVANARVLITGGASGMGRLYAERAVREGALSVTLWDIEPLTLDSTASTLSGYGTVIHTRVVDVSKLNDVRDAASSELAEGRVPDVLINNAGIVRGNAYFWNTDSERDTEPTMRINAIAPMHVTREFLPAMIADRSKQKRILNVASAAGTLANPRMSVYAASKWALIGWSDSVRLELERSGNGHVKITTFCPSYVTTGMFEGARGPLLTPLLAPDVAVARAWQAMLSGKPFRLTPWTVSLARGLKGVLPTAVWDQVADKVFGVYSTMDDFTGHADTVASDPAEPAKETRP